MTGRAKNARKNTACPGGTWSDVALIRLAIATKTQTDEFEGDAAKGVHGDAICWPTMLNKSRACSANGPFKSWVHDSVIRRDAGARGLPDASVAISSTIHDLAARKFLMRCKSGRKICRAVKIFVKNEAIL
jgi:hypothetical protein